MILDLTEDTSVSFLLGCDVIAGHWVFEQKTGGRDQLFATKGRFGWLIRGPYLDKDIELDGVLTAQDTSPEVLLRAMYNREFENLGDREESCPSVEDCQALKLVESSAFLENGYYKVAVPWRPGIVPSTGNRSLALSRLDTLRRHLLRKGVFREKYTSTMNDHQHKRYISITWERKIRSVRRVLSYMAKCQPTSGDTSVTTLAESERMVEGRPIIPVYDDPCQPYALRPSDLLLGRDNPGTPVSDLPLGEYYTKRRRRV